MLAQHLFDSTSTLESSVAARLPLLFSPPSSSHPTQRTLLFPTYRFSRSSRHTTFYSLASYFHDLFTSAPRVRRPIPLFFRDLILSLARTLNARRLSSRSSFLSRSSIISPSVDCPSSSSSPVSLPDDSLHPRLPVNPISPLFFFSSPLSAFHSVAYLQSFFPSNTSVRVHPPPVADLTSPSAYSLLVPTSLRPYLSFSSDRSRSCSSLRYPPSRTKDCSTGRRPTGLPARGSPPPPPPQQSESGPPGIYGETQKGKNEYIPTAIVGP